jgi:citrate synthase
LTPEFLDVTTGFLNLGVLGIICYLFLTGKLHSDSEYQLLLQEKETERVAHEHTREALRIANARGESGALAAEIVARALEGSRHQGGDPHHAQAVES